AIDFKAWIAALLQMTGSQRDRVREQLGSKASSDLCLKLIEQSFTEQRQCPHCTCKELYLWHC
ncbi:MAG: IS1595 family transposase, partial [Ghiorsea sp.]|nr:IS1595 family transposase [Ghiorsea sp.]